MSEINQFLGWNPAEGEDGLDKFQEFFSSKFIAKDKAITDPDIISKMEGRRIGSINTTFNRLFGERLGLNADQLKESKLEDVLTTLKDKWDGEVSEIKSKSKDGTDKRLSDMQKQLEDKDKSISSYKSTLEKLETDFNQFKDNSTSEMNDYMVNHQLSEQLSKLNFKDGISEIEKAGFKTIIGGSLKFQLDENRKLVVRDANGDPIASKKSAAEHATPVEALVQLADQNSLLRKNNASNQNSSAKTVVPNKVNGQTDHKSLPKSYHDRIAALTK
jgi:archaellum component FlaC